MNNSVELAIRAALLCLPSFERFYPLNKTPHRVIEAAKNCYLFKTEQSRRKARFAAIKLSPCDIKGKTKWQLEWSPEAKAAEYAGECAKEAAMAAAWNIKLVKAAYSNRAIELSIKSASYLARVEDREQAENERRKQIYENN